MHHALRRIPLLALTLGTLAAGPRPSAASHEVSPAIFKQFSSPYGPSTPVRVGLGSAPGQQVIIYQNKTTKACHVESIGTSSGLGHQTIWVQGSDAEAAGPGRLDDEITLVTTGQLAFDCSNTADAITLGPLVLASGAYHEFRLFGGKGRDLLVATGAPADLHGGAGNDRLFGPSLEGDDGDDVLVSTSLADDVEYMSGGSGDDCFIDRSGRAHSVYGGEGTDVVVAPLDAQVKSSIEGDVSACPVR
jgi:Ca2+-binding RTX toxin-like protein